MKKYILSGERNPIVAVIKDDESLDRLFIENGTLDHQKIESTFRQNVLAKHSQNMAIILNWLRCYFEGNDFDEGFAKKCLELVCSQDLQNKNQHNQWIDIDLLKVILPRIHKISPEKMRNYIYFYLNKYKTKNDQSQRKKNMECISLLVDKIKETSQTIGFITSSLLKALHKAVFLEDKKMIIILEKLSSVTELEQKKLIDTLHSYCKNGDVKNALSVMKLDANIINKTAWGLFAKISNYTPLKVAIMCEKKERGVEIIKELLNRKVSINNSSFYYSPFNRAILSDNMEALNLLLSHSHSVEQLKNGKDSFKKSFLEKMIKSSSKIGLEKSRWIIEKLIKHGLKDIEIPLLDYVFFTQFLFLYNDRRFFPLLMDLNLILVGNRTKVPLTRGSLGSFILQVKLSNKVRLSEWEKRSVKWWIDVFPAFTSEGSKYLVQSYGKYQEITGDVSKLLSIFDIPKKNKRHDRFISFTEKFKTYLENFLLCSSYTHLTVSAIESIRVEHLQLIEKAIHDKQFKYGLLNPSVRHFLRDKLDRWKVYQQGDNNMGVVARSRRLGVEAAKQERVVEKPVSAFLTYDNFQRLRDHSIVFGRYGMNAIPKRAFHPVSGDGGRAHKRQKVGSSTHSDEGMHQNGSSSSSLKDHSVNMMRQT